MKRKLFFLTLLSSICFFTYAQFENYKLDQYVNPDYKRQSLDFEVSTAGYLDLQKSKMDDISSKYSSKSFNGDLGVIYDLIQNSESRQSHRNLKFNLDGNYLNYKIEDSTLNKKSDFNMLLEYDDNSLYYLNNKNFIELSPHVLAVYKTESETSKDNYKVNYLNLSFRLGYGKGRIEHVEDARLAVYLLEDLIANGVSVKNMTPEIVDKLAQCMTSVKNKRHFDTRLKLIDEITTVDSFLIANNIIDKENNPRYFTTLYDNWQYAGLITRLSGSRFSGGIQPLYIWQKSTPGETSYYTSSLDGAAYVNYTYEKPVNLYWQHSAFVEIKEMVRRYRGGDVDWETNLDAKFSLGYYPNSRTYMTASASENLVYMDSFKRIYSLTSLDFNMYYYLSPQLRLGANASISYIYSKQDNMSYTSRTNNPRLNFAATLTYSFF